MNISSIFKKIRFVLLQGIFALFLFCSILVIIPKMIVSAAAWYNNSWSNRIAVTIDHTKVTDASQTNFPVYIDLSSLPDGFWTTIKSNGSDIVVTDSDGITMLARELVSINTASKTGELWVKVPLLSNSVDTVLYIYFGNASASEANSTSTWNSSFLNIQHMKANSSDPQKLDDATANNNSGNLGENVLTDSGFESGTGWSLSAAASRVTTTKHSGSYGLKIATPKINQATVTKTAITVLPNTRYTLSGWFFSSANATTNLSLDLNDIAEECQVYNGTRNAWTFMSCDFTTSASTTSVYVRIVVDGPGTTTNSGDIFVDDVRLTRGLPTVVNTGLMGNAVNFGGSAEFVGYPALLANKSDWTWSGWIYQTVINGTLYSEGAPGVSMSILTGSNGSLAANTWNVNTSGNWMSTSKILPNSILNKWSYVVATLSNGVDGSGTMKIYVDGTLLVSSNNQKINSVSTTYAAIGDNIGAYYGGGQVNAFYTGKIDELRIANVAESAGWINTEYNNQYAPAGFYTVSAVKTPGNHITISNPAALDLVTADSATSVLSGGEGSSETNQTLNVIQKANNALVASFNVNLSDDLDWSSELSSASGGNRAFFHAASGIGNLPGSTSSSFTLYVPKGDGDQILICPGALALNQVVLGCSGGYYLKDGETKNDATAGTLTANSITYWAVSGLTGTGGMSVVSGLKDNLSRLAAGVASDHTITFGTNYGLIAGSGNTMTIKLSGFDLSNLQLADITLTDESEQNRALATEPGSDTWGVVINTSNNTIYFDVPLSGSGGYDASSQIVIKLGENAVAGTHQIINPATAGTYFESLTISNSVGEAGTIAIPVVDSDQVNVTGYVNTFINFDIDTGTTDTDCAYNTCLNHSGGTSASNYVIDLGELNSTWVNKSEDASVMHSDGNNGAINSIYFDLTTNAYNGAVLYVKSANGGLQGPGMNLIPSVSDGSNIKANDGTYGFQVLESSANVGTIVPNSSCDISNEYCGAVLTAKPVLSTNGRPVDGGRAKMNFAAAASYIDNPGSYADVLTFIVTATY